MSGVELDIDDFLTHSTNSGGSSYLKGWKKSPTHSATIWLHTQAKVISNWGHQLPHLVTVKDEDSGADVVKVWGERLSCWESEANLKLQYRRNNDGTRKAPPEKCPVCKLVEWARISVEDGSMDILTPMFQFEGTDEIVVVRAGHLYNGFSQEGLSETILERMRKAKVFRKEAWRYNANAKAGYIFRVVDNAHPDKGVCIASEPGLLGDKVKAAIAARREAIGMEAGNPLKHPYPFRWKYVENAKTFNDTYAVIALETDVRRFPDVAVPLTEEIRRLITETEAPSVDHLTKRFNAQKVRGGLEAACMVDNIPWTEIFGETEFGDDGYEPPGTDFDPAKLGGYKTSGTVQVPAKSEVMPKTRKETEVEMVACDECGKPMRVTDNTCPHCGHRYVVEQEEEEAPKIRTRAEAAQVRKAEAKKATQLKVQPKVSSGASEVDNLPFAPRDF